MPALTSHCVPLVIEDRAILPFFWESRTVVLQNLAGIDVALRAVGNPDGACLQKMVHAFLHAFLES